MEHETFIGFLSTTATISTFVLFGCGLQICERIRRRGSTEGTSVAPFLITLISCTFWLGYGDLRQDSTIIFVNGVGFIVQSAYLFYFYKKTRVKAWLNRLLAFELSCCIFTYYFVRADFSTEYKENFLGLICMVLNVMSISAPLMDVGQVIRTKSTESLPFFLCLGNLLVSLQWLTYGIFVDDFYMKVPNSIATLISLLQLSLFFIYPTKTYRLVEQQQIPNELI